MMKTKKEGKNNINKGLYTYKIRTWKHILFTCIYFHKGHRCYCRLNIIYTEQIQLTLPTYWNEQNKNQSKLMLNIDCMCNIFAEFWWKVKRKEKREYMVVEGSPKLNHLIGNNILSLIWKKKLFSFLSNWMCCIYFSYHIVTIFW